MKKIKTNAMRMLDEAGIHYEVFQYEVDENDLSGTHIADNLSLPYSMVFKTIVAKGDKSGFCVFCLPVDREIDLKNAAVATNNKKIEPVHVKDLLSVTGYVRGGCSPVGMKKKFPVFFDLSVENCGKITVSAGVRGAQLLVDKNDILKFTDAVLCSIAV